MQLLELQRASAGSGKTFQLAKKFIWYFITISVEGSPRRLRTEAELGDSLKHILAVTFTNKATGEMQQRIVTKLDALANYKPGDEKEPDYLDDFCKDLGVDAETLSRTCKTALHILLENYSDFQVSTIDSFFQLVLRTFAYESNLNDSYGIEIDSEFLARVGIDATFDEIDRKGEAAATDVRKWVEMLMARSRVNGSKWNIFQKSEANGDPYKEFIDALKKLENEDFKEIRNDLEDYFENTPEFTQLYDKFETYYQDTLKKAHKKVKKLGEKLLAIPGPQIKEGEEEDKTYNQWYSHAQICKSSKPTTRPTSSGEGAFAAFKGFGGKTYKDRYAKHPEYYDLARPIYEEMVAARDLWLNLFDTPELKHWEIYRKNFPYLGLLSIVYSKRRDYLRENNCVELAETNILLSRIIGDDGSDESANDTPFIYERLGSRLNHFLIDEFQDTSRLQWRNFRPLLSESLANGNENLLIGDAKQSIYRFRNADSSLISEKVEKQFPIVRTLGDTPGENKNWRSDRNIVMFNNEYFTHLVRSLSEYAPNGRTASLDFSNLYANVSQESKYIEENGYIEINFIKGSKMVADEEICSMIPAKIEELLSRGYQMGEIAILVNTNKQGENIIRHITRHNTENSAKIEFISEESLKVAGSVGVQQILSVLRTIGRGVNPELRQGEEGKKKGVADWREIECNFLMFSRLNSALSKPEQLDAFLKTGSDTDAIKNMLDDLKAVSLPALVEGIVSEFLTAEMRRVDAPFIAAFQDLVLEYCESRPSDIESFLKWWENKGCNASICSPEGTNAVQIMTIHKAKGLEFPCVIMPFANQDFLNTPSKTEWRWVRPVYEEFEGIKMPPFIPIDTNSKLRGSRHENIFNEYVDVVTMDTLNKLYVGMTRACRELYLYCNKSSKSSGGISTTSSLLAFFGSSGDTNQLTRGEKYSEAPRKEKREEKTYTLDNYATRAKLEFLKIKEDTLSKTKVTDETDTERSDVDPRSEGNLYHAAMEQIKTCADVDKAVRRLCRQGLISRARATEMADFITERINSSEQTREWFGGTFRCINERPIIGRGKFTKRPDRVMETADGTAIVVDYKFGAVEKEAQYTSQVLDYIDRLRETGRYRQVTGYIWYMQHNKMVLVGTGC